MSEGAGFCMLVVVACVWVIVSVVSDDEQGGWEQSMRRHGQ